MLSEHADYVLSASCCCISALHAHKDVKCQALVRLLNQLATKTGVLDCVICVCCTDDLARSFSIAAIFILCLSYVKVLVCDLASIQTRSTILQYCSEMLVWSQLMATTHLYTDKDTDICML